MKGGGLTWAGWLAIGVGGLLIYAGMTGQSLVGELAAVLNGSSPSGAGKGAKLGGNLADAIERNKAGQPGTGAGYGAAPNALDAHPPTIPNPRY